MLVYLVGEEGDAKLDRARSNRSHFAEVHTLFFNQLVATVIFFIVCLMNNMNKTRV